MAVNKEESKVKAVHFGAGKIGRGFIGDLLHNSGYEIVFVDVNEKVNAELNKYHNYYLYIIDSDSELHLQNHCLPSVRLSITIYYSRFPCLAIKSSLLCPVFSFNVMITRTKKVLSSR